MSPRNGLPPTSPRLSQDGTPAVASAVTAKKQHEPSFSFSATTPSSDRDTTPLGRNTSSPGRFSSPASGIRRQLRAPPQAQVSPRGTLHRPKFRLPPARKPRTNTPLSITSRNTQQEFRVTHSSTPTSESYKWPLGLNPSASSVGENSEPERVSRSVNKVIPDSPLATSNLSKEKFPSTVEYATVLPDNALPNGWTEAEEPTSGRKYYYNSDTQETSWERPKPVTVPVETSVNDDLAKPSSDEPVVDTTAIDLVENDTTAVPTAVPEVNGAANASLLDGWAEALDPSSGRSYFFNSLTNETSWTRPVAPSSTDEPELSSTTNGHGRGETVVEETAAAGETVVTVKELLASFASVGLGDVGTSDFPLFEPPQTDGLSNSIPAPWTAVEDASGQTYYYNTITGETAWDLPKQEPLAEDAKEASLPSWGEQEESAMATNETETPNNEEPTILPTSDDAVLTADGMAAPEPQREMPPMPPGWTEVIDETSGRPYYFNTISDETSWERPVTEVDEPGEGGVTLDTTMELLDESNPAASMVEVADATDSRTPPVESKRGEESDTPETEPVEVEEPFSEETRIVLSTPATNEIATTDDINLLDENDDPMEDDSPALADNWAGTVDPGTGNMYYYNSVTGETSWERPLKNVATYSEFPVYGAAEEPSTSEDRRVAEETTYCEHTAMDEEPTRLAESPGLVPEEDDLFTDETRIHSSTSATNEIADTNDTVIPEEQEGPIKDDSPVSALADNWVGALDPGTGSMYYYNSVTGETSWERPLTIIATHTEVLVDDAAEEAAEPSTSENLGITEEATRYSAPITEEVTKHAAINEGPTELANSSEPVPESALPCEWSEAVDPSSGLTYFYNSITQETSWERPVIDGVDDVVADDTPDAVEEEECPLEEEVDPVSLQQEAIDESDRAELTSPDEEPTEAIDESDRAELTTPDEEPSILAESPELVTESDLPYEWSEAFDPSSGLTYFYNSVTQATSWERPVRDIKVDEVGVHDTGADDIPDTVEEEESPLEEEVDPISLQQEAIDESDRAELTTPDEEPSILAESPELVTESDLPSGWSEAFDPSSGLTYFYNSVTQATSWERPVRDIKVDEVGVHDTGADDIPDTVEEEESPLEEEVDPISLQQEAIDESDRAALTTPDEEPSILAESPELVTESDLPSGWSEEVDQSSGLNYYYNSTTETTSWERPVRDNMGDEYGVDGSLADETEGAVEDEGPNLQEVDPVGGGQEPLKESDRVDPVIEGSSDDNHAEAIADSSLPDGWQEVVDPSSGQTYFYNAATLETSWEHPAGAGMAQPGKVNIEPLKNAQHETKLDETGAEGNRVDVLNIDGQEETPPVEHLERAPVSSDIPEGWTEVTDPSSGRTYYYNSISQETSWDFPVAVEQAEDGQDEEHSATSVSADGGDLDGESAHIDPADETLQGLESMGLSPTDLPEGWTEKVDPYNGSKYYYNTITYETSYGHPLRDESETETGHEDLTSVESEDHLTPVPEVITDEATASHDFDETEGTDMEPTNDAPSLAPGWSRVVDPSTGQLYYYNSITEETSWELPFKMEPPVDEAIRDGGDDKPDTNDTEQMQSENGLTSDLISLPNGWTESVDPSSGQTFFYNSITQETSWERPAFELSEDEGIFSEETPLVEEEDQITDVAQDNDTFVDEKDEVAESGETTCETTGESSGIKLPECWTEVADPSSGQLYYYNSITQETSWERPTGELDQDVDDEIIPETSFPLEERKPIHSENEASGATDVDEHADSTSWGLQSSSQENSDRPLAEHLGPVLANRTDNNAPTGDEDTPSDLVAGQAFHVDIVDEIRAPEETGSTAHGLQDGWVELLDPSSGQTYYYNSTTEETSWERQVLDFDAIVHDEPETAAEPFESSWGDMDFDKVYGPPEAVPVENNNINTTNEASVAAGSEVDFAPSKNGSLPSGWVENVDPQSRETYYYNSATGETTWDIPLTGNMGNSDDTPAVNEAEIEEVVVEDVSKCSTMPAIPSVESEGVEAILPNDWAEAIDPHTGLTFYVNTVTQVTSWDHPGLLEVKERAEGGEDSQIPVITEEEQLLGESNGPDAVHEIENEIEIDNACQDVKLSPNEPDVNVLPELIQIDGKRTVEDIIDEPDEIALPAGWSEHVDPDSGEIYFYNADRDVTSWDRPSAKTEDVAAEAKSLAGDGPADGDNSVAPFEEPKVTEAMDAGNYWQELVDEASGATYYYNMATDTVTWEKPVPSTQSNGTDFSETISPYDSASPAPDATPCGEEHSSTANAPEELNGPYAFQEPESTLDYEGDGPESENLEVQTQLPPGWVQLVDSNSGLPYYFCEANSTTTWDKPVLEEWRDVALEEMSGASPEIVDGGEGLPLAHAPEYVDSPEEERPEYAPEMADQLGVGPSPEGPPVESDVDVLIRGEDYPSNLAESVSQNTSPEGERPDMASPDEVLTFPNEKQSLGDELPKGLPSGWEELEDPSSGEIYYYNRETNTTSWTLPVQGVEEPDIVEDSRGEEPAASKLDPGWVELVDPNSGQTYYFNEIENRTSWDRPGASVSGPSSSPSRVPLFSEMNGTGTDRSRPGHALGIFAFGGRLITLNGDSSGSKKVVIHRATGSIETDPISIVEREKQDCGISGPLNSSADEFVFSYIKRKVESQPEDLLWHLILIAAKSKGRLRSVEGVADRSSPEAAVVELLLHDDMSCPSGEVRLERASPRKDRSSKSIDGSK
jgi:hypothetical protein